MEKAWKRHVARHFWQTNNSKHFSLETGLTEDPVMKRHNSMISNYLIYEQRLEQLAAVLNKTMDAVFNEMIARLEAQLSDTAHHEQEFFSDSDHTEWLQIGNGEPFGPYDAVKMRGDGASFSEMIAEDRNQT